MKQVLKTALGLLFALCIIWILLVTSIEAVCYWNPGYFEREYEKYDVLSSLPEMSMSEEDGLMAVTNHMMKYLRGDADAPSLQVEVMMGGEMRGFFSERELLHMADVQRLFIGAQKLRLYALLCGALSLILLKFVLCKPKEAFLRLVSKSLVRGIALFAGLTALLSVVVATNFSEAFITFHHIFFDNDLWLLDPNVDMLINIVPEGFFFDTAVRILLVFGAGLFLVLLAAFVFLKQNRRRES